MKCPVCGSENKATNTACLRCGAPLGQTPPKTAGSANALWNRPRTQKPIESPPPFWGDSAGTPSYENKADFVVLNDEKENVHLAQDLVDEGVPVPTNRQKLRRVKSGQEINVVVPPEPVRSRRPPKQRRYRVNWRRLVVSVLLILVVSAGVSYGGYMGYKAGIRVISQWFAKDRAEKQTETPLVEKVLIDGQIWHRITFFGKDGEQVLVDEPRRSLPIQDGKAVLLLDDDSYIPDDLSGSDTKKTIELKATIFSPNNQERTITVPPYTIDIPLSPLKIILPAEQGMETASNRVTVKVKVTPGSRVIIGSDNATDRVNTEGLVSSTVGLEAKGMNTVKITVETKKHRRNVYELQVNHPVLDVPIVLGDDVESQTSDPTIAISGSTAPGATLTTDATLNGDINLDKSSGVFSFTAKLTLWGWNTITLTATDEGGKTSSLQCLVNHVPALESYTKKAWPMDYAHLAAATDTLLGQVYVCEGMVTKKLSNDESDYYQCNLGTADDPKTVVLEYSKEAGLKVGQYYKMYADVIGSKDGYPMLSARFVYEKDTPTSYGDGSASPTDDAQATDSGGDN